MHQQPGASVSRDRPLVADGHSCALLVACLLILRSLFRAGHFDMDVIRPFRPARFAHGFAGGNLSANRRRVREAGDFWRRRCGIYAEGICHADRVGVAHSLVAV